jgi:nicotinamide-nucleotide amidase
MTQLRLVPNIISTLIERGETVSVAESVTAGGLGRALTFSPGASAVFLGGVIAYSNKAKIDLLDVDPELINRHSVISEEVANAMAESIRLKFGTTWGIATTGVAGPGDFEGSPEGTVWISIRGPINQSLQLALDSGRDAIQTGAISSTIGTFARILGSGVTSTEG